MRTALRSRGFAARIIRRFEQRAASPRPLALALVRVRPAPRPRVSPVRGQQFFSTRVRIEPRVALTLVRPTEVRAVTASENSRASSPQQAPLVLTTVVHGRARQLVERITARSRRIERLSAVEPPTPVSAPSTPAGWGLAPIPLALTVRRPSPPPPPIAAAPRQLPADTAVGAPAGRRPVPAASLSAQEAAAGLDIQAVTDSVIAAIDRRVVAEAERTGSL